jgi:putative intracellular protease/amidase
MKYLVTFLTTLCLTIFTQAADTQGNILIVVTSHAKMADGKPTGLWLAEATHPWHEFTSAGYTVHFASPKGANVPIDPRSTTDEDPINKKFLTTPETKKILTNTKKLESVDPANYKAIFFAGGHGTMWDFPNAAGVSKVAGKIYQDGGIVAAVCHGPAALVNLKLPDGTLLIKNKKVTGFTNEEEAAVGLTKEMPFLLEDKLKEVGATFESAPKFQVKVITSERLVTGQNPASAGPAAKQIIKLLSK